MLPRLEEGSATHLFVFQDEVEWLGEVSGFPNSPANHCGIQANVINVVINHDLTLVSGSQQGFEGGIFYESHNSRPFRNRKEKGYVKQL